MNRVIYLAKLLIFVVSVVAIGAASGPVMAQSQKSMRKITIAMAGDGLHISLLHIASLGGFFKEEGLEDDIVDLNSGPRSVAALSGGSADFAPIGLIHGIKAYAEGGDIVIVTTLFDALNPLIFLSNEAIKKTGITVEMPIDEKVKRMQGLRIGTTSPGSVVDTVVRTLFKARGMDPDKVIKLLPLGSGANMMAALEKGATDGFAWSAPIPEIAQAKGLGKIVINPLKGEAPEMRGVPYLSFGTSRATYEKKPEEMLRFARAISKAIKLTQDKPEEAKRLVRSRFPNIDQAIFDAAWETCKGALPTSPVVTEVQLVNTLKWLNYTAEKPMLAPYDKIVVPNPARQAVAEILKK